MANPAWFVRTVEQWAYSSLVVFPAMVTDAPSVKVNSLTAMRKRSRVETIGSSFKAPPQGEPHAPRSQGEANLHAVLHNAIEILRRRLKTVVPEFASSILALIKTKGSWLHSKQCDDDRIYFKRA